MNHYYLLVDVGCLLIPLVASFYAPYPFYKQWLRFLKGASVVALFFLIWDEVFTRLGIWGFNPHYLLDWYIGHLPLEEVLFFYCIPFACVFTYFALRYLVKKNPLTRLHRLITSFLIVISLLFVFLSKGRLYPLVTEYFLAYFFCGAIFEKEICHGFI